jgi:hypothetical protein
MRTRLAGIVASIFLIAGGWVVHSTSTAGALGPDSTGVLTLFPNREVSWGVWYSGVVYPQRGNVLDVGRPENAASGGAGENPATVKAQVPTTALPAGQFVVHTAFASSTPVPGANPGESKTGTVTFFAADGSTVKEFALRLTAPDGPLGIDTIGITEPITTPSNAISMRVGLANFQSGFSLRRVTVNPVAVPLPPLPEARYLDQRRPANTDRSPLPLRLRCRTETTELLLEPEQSTVVETSLETSCALEVNGLPTEWGFPSSCCSVQDPGWTRQLGTGPWVYSLAENKLTISISKVTFRAINQNPNAGLSTLVFRCTGQGKSFLGSVNFGKSNDPVDPQSQSYLDLSGKSCEMELFAPSELIPRT